MTAILTMVSVAVLARWLYAFSTVLTREHRIEAERSRADSRYRLIDIQYLDMYVQLTSRMSLTPTAGADAHL
jgi:hypothetical protein